MRTCHCPICDGPPVVLGQLGNLLWMRCRNCGMDFCKKQPARKVRRREQPGQDGPSGNAGAPTAITPSPATSHEHLDALP